LYCPKPAYGKVYDTLIVGITKIQLPIIIKTGTEGDGVEDFFVPYPLPDVEDPLGNSPYPAPLIP
jgi:hypothetical protein